MSRPINPQARLLILDGDAPPRSHALDRASIVIGRDPGCDVVLPDRAGRVGRQHARIVRRSEGYVLESLHSRNSTLLNGEPVVGPTPLRHADQIRICDRVLTFFEASGESRHPPGGAVAARRARDSSSPDPAAILSPLASEPVKVMAPQDPGSVTRWIGELKGGGGDAAQALWDRYFATLVRLARARLRATSRAAADEEDVALSAFDSFCAGAARGRFPRLEDRGDLWKLLMTITTRKALNQARDLGRQKRGGGRVLGEADLADPAPEAGVGLDAIAGTEPDPQFAAMLAEQFRSLLARLRDETLRQIALLKMEGYTNDEIAARLECGVRTVERKLDLVRKTWSAEDPS
jgi:pSer/pThr/pTyr-binding forkhead associated (FHA) protein/DNA-directed RNA polymerase specialized sigma24 family protein